MRFGIAKDIITPDVSTHMGGYGSLYGKYFRGVHDDLFVKTLLIDDGKTRVVLITLDLLMHDYALTETTADYIQAKHDIPRENLVLSYTHTHAGPAVRGYDPGQASEHFERFLSERIRSCVDRAMVNTFEGDIAFGEVEGDWNISRRKKVGGKWLLRPNPDGEKDNTLSILRIRDTEGWIRALLLNYSCHPVTLGDTLWISAEYPGRLCQLLDTAFYGATTMFFQSAGGCSRPKVSAMKDAWKKCSFDEVDAMASAMADSVQRAARSSEMTPLDLKLAVKQFVVQLETEVYPKEFFRRVAESGDESLAPSKRNEARVVLENYDSTDNVIPLHAAIVRLSDDLFIASLCGEVCYEVKQAVQMAFGDRKLATKWTAPSSSFASRDASNRASTRNSSTPIEKTWDTSNSLW